MPADGASPVPRVLVGTDLVAIDRLASMLTAQPDLAGEVFTERELSYCSGRRRRHEHLAARFAAKEAVFKALGTGLAGGVGWRDVEVVNAASGRPRLRLAGAARSVAGTAGVRSMEISLSHTAHLAIAFAVLVCDGAVAP
ncbi:holo-[acyl-carrier-protein] synthase [Micromonospora sp. Llam0]|nr:holo-[acyl-carrier-protein] synthase [Micromonospora sp. Llam0]